MRRTQKTVEKLLTELERTGIPLTACSKVGVGRSTYYRWRQENITFKLMTDEAIRIGRENITDLAESKLVKNISDGNQRAIEFQLRHNDSRYRYFNQLEFAKMLESRPQEGKEEESKLQTFVAIVFDSIESELIMRTDANGTTTDGDIPEDIEILNKKLGAIRYMTGLFEAEAEKRLKDIIDVTDEDASK